jgi:hypothetical protein
MPDSHHAVAISEMKSKSPMCDKPAAIWKNPHGEESRKFLGDRVGFLGVAAPYEHRAESGKSIGKFEPPLRRSRLIDGFAVIPDGQFFGVVVLCQLGKLVGSST